MSIRKTYTMESASKVEDINLLWENVLIKPVEEKEIGGILLPQSSSERGQKGIVCRVGPGTKDVEMEVQPGDKVLFVKYAGSEIAIEGEKFNCMKQEDILGRYHGDRDIDLTPLEDRILIEWEFGQDEYMGTNILRSEGAAKERYYTGIVMATGPLVQEIKVGDRVFFNQFCGPERIDFESKRYALIWEKDARGTVPLRKSMMVLSH